METQLPTRRRKRSRFSSLPVDTPPPASAPTKPTDPPPLLEQPLELRPLRGKSARLAREPRQQSNQPFSLFASDDDTDDEPAAPARRRYLPGALGSPGAPARLADAPHPPKHAPQHADAAPEADPLDAFMQNIHALQPSAATANLDDDDDDDAPARARARAPESHPARPKRPVYEKVDHSKIDYPPFAKSLYIQVPELSRLTPSEVAARRRALSIRVRGRGAPPPAAAWPQCGLASTTLVQLARLGFSAPTPVQAQAIPAVMSGRDVIGVARTGSGKTLAFVLPLLRHVALQTRAAPGDGPAGLIVAPTRELAIQIFGDAQRFARAVELRCVCAYGGSGVKDQIAELKRGADVVICTPGRMIDLLAMNGGRITNLRRVTFVVLDEADRMFDMGFEPQLTRIVENIRPDRQTVMFSATFPVQVEKLARKVLKQPLEIMVGGNSVAAATIDQHVEVRREETKFFRLLELLGLWYEKGSTLVFVDRQDNADRIFRELSKARYKCLSLHGGMDQADRDSTIVDFKNGDVKVLVATSVAARGLDVKNLTLVVNFDVPSHYEDYVHRVGRTGRAGKAGTAYTFITPEQEAFAGDLVKALEVSARSVAEAEAPPGNSEATKKAADEAAEAAVPEELRKLADAFALKRKAGIVKYGASSGYGGRGFKFEENDEYDAAKTALRKAQAKQYGMDDDAMDDDDNDDEGTASDDEDDDEDDGIVAINTAPKASISVTDAAKGSAGSQPHAANKPLTSDDVEKMLEEAVRKAEGAADAKKLNTDERRALVAKAKANVLTIAAMQKKASRPPLPSGAPSSSAAGDRSATAAASAAAAAAAAISAKLGGSGPALVNIDDDAHDELPVTVDNGPRFAGELEINDYPQHARWQVTRKGSLNDVEEFTGCVITTRGNFYPAGRNPPAGERKLHFLIEGPSRRAVKTARRDIRQKLEEAAAVSRPGDQQYSKYSVV